MRIRIEHDPDKGCFPCPFSDDDRGICNAAKGGAGREYGLDDSSAPEWCPLRESGHGYAGTPIIEVGAPDAWERESVEENDE